MGRAKLVRLRTMEPSSKSTFCIAGDHLPLWK
jgi:hypothetical protein